MPLTADDLEGKPVVFALAQQPFELKTGESIATLWPLMCFSTGQSVKASALSFPSAGYVGWFRVPPGDWNHGDLIIGTLRRNERKFGVKEKEWFQVIENEGYHAGGKVCEIINITESVANLRDFLKRPVQQKPIPRNDVYFRCIDAIVGPFCVTQGRGGKSGRFYFTPERRGDRVSFALRRINGANRQGQSQ